MIVGVLMFVVSAVASYRTVKVLVPLIAVTLICQQMYELAVIVAEGSLGLVVLTFDAASVIVALHEARAVIELQVAVEL